MTPLVKNGILVRLYPDRPRHLEQAYQVKPAEKPRANGTVEVAAP